MKCLEVKPKVLNLFGSVKIPVTIRTVTFDFYQMHSA